MMSVLRSVGLLALVLLSGATAHAQSKPVVIEDAWVRLFEGTVSAYFHILNNSEEPDRLLSVSTTVADRAQLIRTVVRGGKRVTQTLDGLDIGGFDDPRLRPGGVHVRFSGLKRRLAVGDPVPLTLRFARSGTIEVEARVSNQLLGNR